LKIFRADLISARPLDSIPLGTGVVMLSSVISKTGLFDAWIPLEGSTHGSDVGEVHVVMLFTPTRRAVDAPHIGVRVCLNMTHTHTHTHTHRLYVSDVGV
jgi:hypothetical protein